MSSDRLFALVPLRGGSKGIPGKNIKLMAGKPLCAWVLEAACETKDVDKVFVSTDSEKIADEVIKLGLGVEVLMRPAELATDTASTESVMLHFTNLYEFETLITIQATSPLTTSFHLTQATQKFHRYEYDSMLSVVHDYNFLWDNSGTPLNYDPRMRPRRQDWNGAFIENGAFYITKRNILVEEKCRLGGEVGLYKMSKKHGFEIDDEEDWEIIEMFLSKDMEKRKGI